MSTTGLPEHAATKTGGGVDMKLEVIVIPVSDVDRAREFYERIGWRLDADLARGDFRLVQMTPPGSGCSVAFGTGLTPAAPGTSQNLELVVSDIEAARDVLVAGGVEAVVIFHGSPWSRVPGPDPERQSYRTYGAFADPDGNGWLLQEVTTRMPGRLDPGQTAYGSVKDLAAALERAAIAHHEHEGQSGERDANWPAWYAEYMVAERAGDPLPS
jgi:catechol 2,3-dioxygenase-like lactoylglutathione lyase family enzyme